MRRHLLKISEALTTNIGQPVESDRVIYTTFFIIPLNILAEIAFFINTYIIKPLISALKIFIGRRPSLVGIYGVMVLLLMVYPRAIQNTHYFYWIAGIINITAFMASRGLLVAKNGDTTKLFIINKLLTTMLHTIGVAFILFLINGQKENQSLYIAVGVVFLSSLCGWKFRASMGRRASFMMVSAAVFEPVYPDYYVIGATTILLLVLFPSIYKFYYGKTEGDTSFTYRDLEVMKLFGQSSGSGYAFEERLIPVIDSLGYDTKFARWYKDNRDYPPEYLNKSGAGDGGLDLIGMSPDNIMLIQCKFYNGAITAAVVAQLCTSRKIFGRYFKSKGDNRRVSLMIVTNSVFDSTAKANAKEEGVILVDGDALKKMVASGKFDIKTRV